METEEAIAQRYAHLAGTLDERGRRAVAAAEALVLGRGGLRAVARATGLSRPAMALGIREVRGQVPLPPVGRVRRPGGGRQPLEGHDPTRRADLERLVAPSPRGDRESPLRWTGKSVRRLAGELRRHGHAVSQQKVAERLHALG
jgi:Rhodopirellula transposase DDE domain